MLKSNKIVSIGARIMVHAHNSTKPCLVEKFLFLASRPSFNMEKLFTIATCTTEKWKAGANAQMEVHAWGWVSFEKKCILKIFFFLQDAF